MRFLKLFVPLCKSSQKFYPSYALMLVTKKLEAYGICSQFLLLMLEIYEKIGKSYSSDAQNSRNWNRGRGPETSKINVTFVKKNIAEGNTDVGPRL